MKKESTLEMLMKKDQKSLAPKKTTIELLKQFARVYTYDNRLQKNLGEFLVN